MVEYLRENFNKSGSLVSVLSNLGKTLTYVDIETLQLAHLNFSTSSKMLLAFVAPTYEVSAYGMWSMTDSAKLGVLHGVNLPFFKSLNRCLCKLLSSDQSCKEFLRTFCSVGYLTTGWIARALGLQVTSSSYSRKPAKENRRENC